MKKLLILALSVFVASNIAMADDKPIEFNNLPEAAKSLVKEHFADKKITSATMDKDGMDTEYKVHFSDGCKVEFNKDGQWRDLDCEKAMVPPSLIPEKIAKHLIDTYPGIKVLKMEKERSGYDLKLSNGLELKFDNNQKFLRLAY